METIPIWGGLKTSKRKEKRQRFEAAARQPFLSQNLHTLDRDHEDQAEKDYSNKGGRGSLVIKVTDSWPGRVMSSILVPLKSRRVGEGCTLNLSRLKCPPVGVEVRRGVLAQCLHGSGVSLLVRFVDGDERCEALNPPPRSVLPQNWGGTELNRTVTCRLKANDRRTSSPLP
ncbi:hypothetical protein TNCV_2563091 [Trichonephila clavipes]|uniref:Uncharacterized protein n=1 Tax=Trichonephila clavipes TaxID=2585209 RepID=A0A8X6R1I1_TRICX|nr:hypothetical protein TNCV_2563091 [Trichonephila clavipes]